MILAFTTELLNSAYDVLAIGVLPQCLQMTLYTAEEKFPLTLIACFEYLLNHIISILVLHHCLIEHNKWLANIT